MKKTLNKIKKYSVSLIIAIIIISIYLYLSESKVFGGFLFPPIKSVFKVFTNDFDILLKNMLSSFALMFPSMAIALIISLTLGTFLGLNTKIRISAYPAIYSFSVVPSILLSPFALLLAPSFRAASILLIVYNTIWGTLFATITGISTIDKRYLDNAATLEISGFKKLFKIILPAASPSILSGFVNSLRGTFVVLVYAEMYGAKYGMGFHVKKYTDYALYDQAIAGFIFMVVVLVVVMLFFEKLKNRILRWTIN